MATRMLKKTNRLQFERLVELMKENADIARSCPYTRTTRAEAKHLWDEFAEKINLLGPPIRNGKEWQKVWIDLKAKVKKIIMANNAELRATGEGPFNITILTPLQQNVDSILQISAGLNLSGNISGFAEDTVETTAENILPLTVSMDQNKPSVETITRRKRSGLENARLQLLRKQTENQEEIVGSNKKIEKNTYKIGKQLEKLVELKREELELMKRVQEEDRMDKLEERKLKLQEIELKTKELDLKRRKLELS